MTDEEYYHNRIEELSITINQERKEKEELRSKNATATVVAFFLGLACFFLAYMLFIFDCKIKDLHEEVAYYQELCDEYNETP